MFYSFELNEFPTVRRIYTVTRNTVWQFSEKENLIILITEGRCSFTCDGQTITAKPGDVVFIPAGTPYVRIPIDEMMSTMTYIHFSLNSVVEQESVTAISDAVSDKIKQIDESVLNDETNIDYPHTIYLPLKTTADLKEMKELYETISLFSFGRHYMGEIQTSISLCNILALLSQKNIDTILTNIRIRDIQEIPQNLKKAIRFINLHYSQTITLNDLCSLCKVSKQQLIRYFKKAFHTTPIDYITQFKITKAKEFLFRNQDLNIKEISAELGFDNQHYFTRVFKKATGETPSQYRYRTLNYDFIENSSSFDSENA